MSISPIIIEEIKEKHYIFCKEYLGMNIHNTIQKIEDNEILKGEITQLFDEKLETLLCSMPVNIELANCIIREISKVPGSFNHLTEKGNQREKDGIPQIGSFKEVIEGLFLTNYNLLGNKDDNKVFKSTIYGDYYWNSYVYTKKLGINVCPYCNSEFIFTQLEPKVDEVLKLAGAKMPRITIRPQLDHFISQKSYPILASSIFNLVPCCKTCNSAIKHAIEVDMEKFINPLEMDIYESISFCRRPKKNIDHYSQITGRTVEFELSVEKKEINFKQDVFEKSKNTIEFFRIIERYEPYKEYIQNIVSRELLYSRLYNENLEEAFPKLFSAGELDYLKKIGNLYGNQFIFSKILNDLLN